MYIHIYKYISIHKIFLYKQIIYVYTKENIDAFTNLYTPRGRRYNTQIIHNTRANYLLGLIYREKKTR